MMDPDPAKLNGSGSTPLWQKGNFQFCENHVHIPIEIFKKKSMVKNEIQSRRLMHKEFEKKILLSLKLIVR